MGKFSRKTRKKHKEVQKKVFEVGTPVKIKEGISHLFSYPFWLFTDTSKILPTMEFLVEDNLVRIYPLFRSAPANFLPMPFIDAYKIPLKKASAITVDYATKNLSVVPLFDRQPDGSFGMTFYTSNQWGSPPVKFPMDSIRIDVIGDKSDSFLAYEIADKLIKQLRWHTGQWWIGYSSDVLSGNKRNQFDISREGEPLSPLIGLVRGRTLSGDEKVIDVDIWESAISNIKDSVDVPLQNTLLQDAKYFAAAHDIRRSVLDSATACEVAKNTTFERLNLKKEGTDIIKHISDKLNDQIHRSYMTEEPIHFDAIKQLWIARGNIAHGKVEYNYNGQPVIINAEKCFEFAKSADKCVRWLEAL